MARHFKIRKFIVEVQYKDISDIPELLLTSPTKLYEVYKKDTSFNLSAGRDILYISSEDDKQLVKTRRFLTYNKVTTIHSSTIDALESPPPSNLNICSMNIDDIMHELMHNTTTNQTHLFIYGPSDISTLEINPELMKMFSNIKEVTEQSDVALLPIME